MNDSNDPLLLGHEADGIRELDNKLPRWWVWLFYLTTIFAAIYLLYYHIFGAGDLMAVEYAKEMKIGEAIKSSSMSKFEQSLSMIEPSKDLQVIENGKATFIKT